LPNYVHEFEDGRQAVLARAYPNELLLIFGSTSQKSGYDTEPESTLASAILKPWNTCQSCCHQNQPPAREPASHGGSIGLESEREYSRLAVAITAMGLKNYRESAHDAESRTHDRLEHFESPIVQRAAGRYAQVAGRGSEIG
jgi:hypothetical protein